MVSDKSKNIKIVSGNNSPVIRKRDILIKKQTSNPYDQDLAPENDYYSMQPKCELNRQPSTKLLDDSKTPMSGISYKRPIFLQNKKSVGNQPTTE
jgi:hypothetical protein